MLTPQEVSGKVFPKASFGGYSMSAVDEFLDALTEDYTTLYKENATLKAKLKVLAEKVEEYRATEDAMRSTLLTAQRMAAQMVQDAQVEKDMLLATAREETAAQVAALELETAQAQQKLVLAQQELAAFVQHSQELCAAQAAFLAQLPEMELAAPAVDDVMTQDTVRMIERDIIKEYTAAQSAPEAAAEEEVVEQEEAAAEEVTAEQVPAVEDEEAPFPADFNLNLDELKFGRNYTGE